MLDPILSFLDMGGYAAFVWPALSLTAVVLIGMLVVSLQMLRRGERELRQLEGRRGVRRRRG